MGFAVKKLKVRPQKKGGANPCSRELVAMLGCWAASGDLMSNGACAKASTTLFECMRTTPFQKKGQAPAINYHLARLGKNIGS